jgi:hypothetical protein
MGANGGPLSLDAASILRRMRYDVEVVVLGPNPSRVPAHPSLRALGYIHKRREFQRFVETVRSFHRVACFLESRRPVLGARVRSPWHTDHHDCRGTALSIPTGARLGVSVEADGERVAEALAEGLREPRDMRR